MDGLGKVFCTRCHHSKEPPKSQGQPKTCLVGLLIRSILRGKNGTSASARVQFFQRKIERINRPTKRVFLQSAHCNQKNRTFHTRLSKAPCITCFALITHLQVKLVNGNK